MPSASAPPARSSITPRIDFDVPCPVCQYNLRGLTTHRCPECGGTFARADLPLFLELARERAGRSKRIARIVALIFVGLCTLAALAPVLGYAVAITVEVGFWIGLGAAGFGLVAAVQTSFEVNLARLVIRSGHPRRFRAWWEGTMISYGASAVALWFAGWGLRVTTRPIDLSLRDLWPVLLVNLFTSIGLQWWTVRTRARSWDDTLLPRRLLLACVLAKTVSAAMWVYVPLPLARI